MIEPDTDIKDIVVETRDIRKYITFTSSGHTFYILSVGGVSRRRGIKASP